MFHKITEKLLHSHKKEGEEDVVDNHDSLEKPALVVSSESTHQQPSIQLAKERKTVQHQDHHQDHHQDTHHHTHDTTTHEGVVHQDTIVRPTIVEEHARQDKVIEIQPVIHKEIEQSIVHHVEQHIVEPAPPSMGGVITHAPIIVEHVTRHVVEEVQPIVHREIAVPRVEKVEEHVAEHVVAAPIHTHEVKETIYEQPTVLPAIGAPAK